MFYLGLLQSEPGEKLPVILIMKILVCQYVSVVMVFVERACSERDLVLATCFLFFHVYVHACVHSCVCPDLSMPKLLYLCIHIKII